MNTNDSKQSSSSTQQIGPGLMGGRGRGPMGHGGPMAMVRRGEKPRDFKGTLKKLVQYLGTYRIPILLVWLLAAASTASMIVGPKILGKATTKLFEGVLAGIAGTGAIDFHYIGSIIIQVLLLYVFSSILNYGQGWIMTDISMKITYQFRKDISQKINHLPLKYFDSTNCKPDSEPGNDPNYHFCRYDPGCIDHDADNQLADDPYSNCHITNFTWHYWLDHQQISSPFQESTGFPRSYQRAC
jgi:ABC-type multidrug transport system fused ATPase/permease subunit